MKGILMRPARFGCFVLIGGVLVTAGAALWSPADWLTRRLARWFPGCVYRVPTRERIIALTIDDGPDPILAKFLRERLDLARSLARRKAA